VKTLPDGFESIENWVDDWSLSTQNTRWEKRLSSTPEEIISFYHAIVPHLDKILDYVDRSKFGELSEAGSRLYCLALMVAEISPNVELYDGNVNVPHSFEERRFIADHGDVVGYKK